MKAIRGTIRQPNNGHAPEELLRNEVVISLPDFRLIRLMARSMLLVSAILSLPWLRSALISDFADFAANFVCSADDDELFYMPKLLQDMKAHGLIQPQSRSLFLGNPGLHDALLWRNGISCLPEHKIPYISSAQAPDFVFIVARKFNATNFRSIDRIIKVGGVISFRLRTTHPVKPFILPANYRMIYIQNLGRTIIAVKKLYHENIAVADVEKKPKRNLLSDSKAPEKEADQTQSVLKPPHAAKKHRKLIKYLKKAIDEPSDEHPRRALEWFKVRKEEMVKRDVTGLMDEWFIKCRIDGESPAKDEKWRKKAYCECQTLFGKLRENGVAVHQWWG